MWDKFQGARPLIGHFKGTRFQRGPKGGSSPWILSHSNFMSGTLILSLESWVLWILFSSYLTFGTYLIFRCQPFQFRSNLHLWLERKKKKHPWLMKSPAKLASNCNKGAWSLFCWALLPCLSNSPLNISSPWNLIGFEFSGQEIEFDPNKKVAKSCDSSVPA